MNNKFNISRVERIIALISGIITIYLFLFLKQDTSITLKMVFIGISAFFIGLSLSSKQTDNTIIDFASRYRLLSIIIACILVIWPIGLDILLAVNNWQAINAETPSMGAGTGGFLYVFGSLLVLAIIYALEWELYQALTSRLVEYYNGRINFQNKELNNSQYSLENEEKDE